MCNVMLCYAILFNVMLCHVMFCHVMLCLPSVCAIVFFCNGPRNNKDNTFVLKKINTNAYLDFHIKDTRCAHWLVTWDSIWTICFILLPFLHACIINAYYVMILQTFFCKRLNRFVPLTFKQNCNQRNKWLRPSLLNRATYSKIRDMPTKLFPDNIKLDSVYPGLRISPKVHQTWK